MTKKLWQRVAAVAMATFMAACTLTTSAFAAQYDDSIPGSITVHKYSTPTAPDSGKVDFDGSEIVDTSSFGTPLQNAGFKLYMVEDPTSSDPTSEEGTVPGFDFTKKVEVTLGGDTPNYTVTFKDADGTTIVKNATVATNNAGTPFEQQMTDVDGTTVFADLNPGKLYILEESKTPEGHTAAAPSLIRVPLTLNDGTGFNYNVHVYPKNVNNTYATKVFNGQEVGLVKDQAYSWTITANFKNRDKTDPVNKVSDLKTVEGVYGTVKITDHVADYFDASNNGAVVKLINAAGNDLVTLTATTDYTLTYTFTADRSNDMVITLTNAGIDKAIAQNAAAVVVTFNTKYVGSTEVGQGTTPEVYKNTATVLVKAPNDETDTPENPEDTVPTINLQVNKFGIDGNNPAKELPGVKFKLAIDKVGTEFVKGANGEELEAVTDASGNIIFSNVPYNKTSGTTLYLVETATAAGYQLKEAPIEVKIGAGKTGTETITISINNYKQGTPDPDQPALQLPLTGGTGTVMLVIAGIGVLVLVGFLTVAANRKSRKEQ